MIVYFFFQLFFFNYFIFVPGTLYYNILRLVNWSIIHSWFLLLWIFQYYLLLSPLTFSVSLVSLSWSFWHLFSTCPICFYSSIPTVLSSVIVTGNQNFIYLGQWDGSVCKNICDRSVAGAFRGWRTRLKIKNSPHMLSLLAAAIKHQVPLPTHPEL